MRTFWFLIWSINLHHVMYTHVYIKKYLSQHYTARGNIRSFASILSMKVNQNIRKSFIQKQHQIVLMYSCSIGAELFILIHIQPTRLLLYITCINYITEYYITSILTCIFMWIMYIIMNMLFFRNIYMKMLY